MVYIISGIVQVYSEEDGETPIINLGPGTCLGESSLFCSYPSSCTMVCRTYCEMNVLERTDFINTMWRYGEEYNRLRRIVQDRYGDLSNLNNPLLGHHVVCTMFY